MGSSMVLILRRAVVEADERGVQGGGLARPGGAGDEDQAAGILDHGAVLAELRGCHAELFEHHVLMIVGDQPQGQVFAVQGRNGADSEVDAFGRGRVVQLDDPSPVLRSAALGAVHAGFHFHVGEAAAAMIDGQHAERPHDSKVPHLHGDVVAGGGKEKVAGVHPNGVMHQLCHGTVGADGAQVNQVGRFDDFAVHDVLLLRPPGPNVRRR